jgi:hypothetical protein
VHERQMDVIRKRALSRRADRIATLLACPCHQGRGVQEFCELLWHPAAPHISLGRSSSIGIGFQGASGRSRSACRPKALASSGERTRVTSDALSQFTHRIAMSAPPLGHARASGTGSEEPLSGQARSFSLTRSVPCVVSAVPKVVPCWPHRPSTLPRHADATGSAFPGGERDGTVVVSSRP